MWVCASPAYAESHGMPSSIEDVLTHDCINFRCGSGRVAEWEFKTEGGTRRILPEAKVTYNDPELVLQAALDGQGLAQMPGYLVDKHLEQGGLVPCLESYAMDDRGHYICYQSRQHMPTRMRVFIDFVTERIRASHVR
jgi:DNA-binding transcriptional LysR family regulator